MKRIFTLFIIIIFSFSFYLIPSLSAMTLGEIKSDEKEERAYDEQVNDQQKDDTLKKHDEPDGKIADKASDKKKNDSPKKVNRGREVSPRLVCLLSVIMPGGGHFYLNNDSKGIAFCLAAGVGYTASGFFMVKTTLAEDGSVEYRNYLLLTGFLFFITLIIHFVGIIEAYSDAEEINKKSLFNGSDNPFDSEVIIE